MKQIPLTRGMFALVDDEDFEQVAQFKWQAFHGNSAGYTWYAKRDTTRTDGRHCIQMHRFILNPRENEIVDHVNGNGLDNRRENLRIVNHTQNMLNQRKRKDRPTPYRGVRKVGDRYRAYAGVNKKQVHLGYYDTAEEAGKVVEEYMRTLHGDYYATRSE